MWNILPGAKNYMAANCVGQGIHRARRLCCMSISMYAHLAEIVSEARLHEPAGADIKGLTWRIQNIVDDRGNSHGGGRGNLVGDAPLERGFALCLTLDAFLG